MHVPTQHSELNYITSMDNIITARVTYKRCPHTHGQVKLMARACGHASFARSFIHDLRIVLSVIGSAQMTLAVTINNQSFPPPCPISCN